MFAVLGLEHQPDRRTSARYPVNIEARIVSDQIWCALDCVIRNRSERGAKLYLPMAVKLPKTFVVEIPSERITVPVRLIWRRGPSVGVEFIGKRQPASDSL